jgi:hypothetical protein
MKLRSFAAVATASLLFLTACGSDAATTTTGATEPGAAQEDASNQPTETTAAPSTTTTTTTTTTPPADTAGGEGLPPALAAALTKTSEINSGRMEGSFEIIGAEGMPVGTSLSLPFSGAFDNTAELFTFTMDMTGMAGELGGDIPPELADMFGVMEVRQIGETTYMSWPFFQFLGVQTPWISTPTDESDSATAGFAAATPGNPADFLSSFENTNATIEELGRETVRGVETTHFLATFDTEALLAEATPEEIAEMQAQGPIPFEELPMEIWIGDDGLVYRYSIDVSAEDIEASEGQGFERMLMIFEMFDWGEEINIEAPPADQVTDGADLDMLIGP